MRRSVYLATALLAALTALTLLAAAMAVRPPGLPAEADAPDEAANRAVVHRFYEATNAAIATGDLAPLATVVAPGLLDDGEEGHPGSGGSGLRRRLLALRATNPALRLTVEDLAVDGDLAIARVGIVGTVALASPDAPTPPSAFLGLALVEQPALWSPVDVLRVANGRIAAHGDGSPETGLLDPAVAARLDVPPGGSRVVTVHRLTVATGAEHAGRAVAGPRLLLLEAGAPTITILSGGPDGRAGPLRFTPAVGETLTVWPGGVYAVRNDGEIPAVLLDVLTDSPAYLAEQPANAAPPVPESGVEVRLLAGGLPANTPTGPAVLSIGRATLAPGDRLVWAETAGPVLLHVETGRVDPDHDADDAWVRDSGSGTYMVLGDDPLAADDGAIVKAGDGAAFRAAPDTPTTVLIATLFPAEDAAAATPAFR